MCPCYTSYTSLCSMDNGHFLPSTSHPRFIYHCIKSHATVAFCFFSMVDHLIAFGQLVQHSGRGWIRGGGGGGGGGGGRFRVTSTE